jgi:undecaprenyl-diphosphatase
VSDRLISPRSRTAVLLVALACAIVTAVLGAHYSNTSSPGRIDRTVDLHIKQRLADHHHLLAHLVQFGAPGTVATLTFLLVLICLVRRRWRAAVLSILGTLIAVGLTELVLKPLVDRHIGLALSFPSGHTTGAFAIAVTAVVLLFEDHSVRVWLRVGLVVLSLGLAAGVAAAVVGLGYHYATDAVGGFCVALGTVLAVAVAIDLFADRNPQLPAISRKRS